MLLCTSSTSPRNRYKKKKKKKKKKQKNKNKNEQKKFDTSKRSIELNKLYLEFYYYK
jgi:hypothetical protein